MSGGHFDYDHHRISYVADEIKTLIDKLESGDKDTICCEKVDDEFIAKLKKIAKDAEDVYQVIHSLDYFLSGDSGLESFNKTWERVYGNVKLPIKRRTKEKN